MSKCVQCLRPAWRCSNLTETLWRMISSSRWRSLACRNTLIEGSQLDSTSDSTSSVFLLLFSFLLFISCADPDGGWSGPSFFKDKGNFGSTIKWNAKIILVQWRRKWPAGRQSQWLQKGLEYSEQRSPLTEIRAPSSPCHAPSEAALQWSSADVHKQAWDKRPHFSSSIMLFFCLPTNLNWAKDWTSTWTNMFRGFF